MTGAPEGNQALLSVRDLGVTFQGVHAVDGLSLEVEEGRIVSLIGPNGAGKTTALNAISGFVRGRGSILFSGTQLLGLPAYRRAALGVGRTFQNLQLFPSMTLLENVQVGSHSHMGGNMLLDVVRLPVLGAERRAKERCLEILGQMGLMTYAHRPVEVLPFGIQKLAGIARALAMEPRLLLLDEPAAGLHSAESRSLEDLIVNLRNSLGLAILLVEHNMRLVMSASDHVIVLDRGQKLAEGPPEDVGKNESVIAAYLGGGGTRTVQGTERARGQ